MKKYERSTHSQWGEDGILEEIFRRIGITNKIACEIGAWDGRHFSNTLNLAENWGFVRILCEADEQRAMEATKNFPESQVFGRCENIDSILAICKCPVDIDLLSIDVDGDDYYLWADMVKYRPRVVVIEYNQTVPPGLDIKQERGGSFGASSSSMINLAYDKRYYLAHATVTNLIFIAFECAELSHLTVKLPTDWLCYVAIGYNGKRYMIGNPAHNDNQGGTHEKLITDVKIQPI